MMRCVELEDWHFCLAFYRLKVGVDSLCLKWIHPFHSRPFRSRFLMHSSGKEVAFRSGCTRVDLACTALISLIFLGYQVPSDCNVFRSPAIRVVVSFRQGTTGGGPGCQHADSRSTSLTAVPAGCTIRSIGHAEG